MPNLWVFRFFCSRQLHSPTASCRDGGGGGGGGGGWRGGAAANGDGDDDDDGRDARVRAAGGGPSHRGRGEGVNWIAAVKSGGVVVWVTGHTTTSVMLRDLWQVGSEQKKFKKNLQTPWLKLETETGKELLELPSGLEAAKPALGRNRKLVFGCENTWCENL
jgi:hypothetical protein